MQLQKTWGKKQTQNKPQSPEQNRTPEIYNEIILYWMQFKTRVSFALRKQ